MRSGPFGRGEFPREVARPPAGIVGRGRTADKRAPAPDASPWVVREVGSDLATCGLSRSCGIMGQNDLVGVLQFLLQSKRIRVAGSLADAVTLGDEMKSFRVMVPTTETTVA